MKVVLISPHPDVRAFGMRTLAACLKEAHHEVQLIFMPTEFRSASFTRRYDEHAMDQLVEMSSDAGLVGLSLMTNFFDNSVQITERLKRDIDAPILWGGIHPTIRPAESLQHADMICTGEGEESLVELVGRLESGESYHDVQGMWFKENGKHKPNPLRPLIRDLDDFPYQDYDYDQHYIYEDGVIRNMNEDLLAKYTRGTYMTLPSRGCPFRCTYCVNNTLNQMYPTEKAIRKRSADHTIGELTQAIAKFPSIKRVVFDDDAYFIYSADEVREFCIQYKEEVGLPLFITGATPTTMNREKLSMLVDAGLVELRMGIESASQTTKTLYKRTFGNDKIENAVRIINEFKDVIKKPQYDVILDNPWENDDDKIESLMFFAGLPAPYEMSLFSLTFYPETDLHKLAVKDGIVTNDLEDVYRKYYHGCEKTYFNNLFFLLNVYVSHGKRISPKLMNLLTHHRMRQIKAAQLIYGALKFRAFLSWTAPSWITDAASQGPFYLLKEAAISMRKGQWSRVFKWVRERTPIIGKEETYRAAAGATNTTFRTHEGFKEIGSE